MHAQKENLIGWANETRLPPGLYGALALGIVALFCAFLLNWEQTLLWLTASVALISVMFSCVRLAACLTPKPADPELELKTSQLPNYTVLVPIFREANMAETLMNRLAKLEYPREKLDIIIICEAVDPDTIKAVKANLRPPFRLIIVPKGTPQTKPRALNYALSRSQSDLVTIYDAEDRPHPKQLIMAANAFAQNPKWQALQAPLNYYNARTNWLTRQFALEYAALFHVWVPFLARLGMPFPLGGTSNHMRRLLLEELGGWDPYNVTEDADLSFRIAAYGGKIGYISLPTDEEAVSQYRAWHFQRARWIKGFMQSWSVHMNQALMPGGWQGMLRFFTLQLTLGMTLLSIWFYTPTLIILGLFYYLSWLSHDSLNIPMIYMCSFGFSIGVGILIGAVGAIRSKQFHLLRWVISIPAYWVLLYCPALRAAWEMQRMPFHWHKTRHGVTAPPEIETAIPLS